MSQPIEFHICIIGCSGVGKSSIMDRITTGLWTSRHVPTTDLVQHTLIYHTNEGIIRCTVTEHNEIDNNDKTEQYLKADAFIGIVDKCDPYSQIWMVSEIQKITTMRNATPVMEVGANKSDKKINKKTQAQSNWQTLFPAAMKCSAKNNYLLDDLFVSVFKQLTGKPDLQLVEPPPIAPPEVDIVPNVMV